MSKFSDFDNNVKNDSNNYNSNNTENEKKINDLYEKYSNFSEQDLLKEFIKISNIKKNDGSLDNNKLNEIVSKLDSHLSTEQKEKLNNLLNMVK